ncbi:MAG: TolB family protein, partial [Chloroflexota bacterium]
TQVVRGGLARDPAGSPDGARIAYSYTPPLPAVRGPGGLLPLPVTDVYAMNADGSDAKVLVAHDAPGVGYDTPVWAPDGKSLFVTYTELVMESNIVKDQIVEVARVPLDGGTRQTLAMYGMSPTVSPDGTRLAFISHQPEGVALLLADAAGQGTKALVPPGRMDGLASPHFSPDGRQVVFSAIAPMAPIPTVTPLPAPAGRAAAGARFGAVARDLTAALVMTLLPRAAGAHGLPMDLFVIGVDGTAPRRLTQLGEDSPAAVWSPDGTRLAILSGGGLYVVNVDGSNLTSIDQNGGHGAVDWRSA